MVRYGVSWQGLLHCKHIHCPTGDALVVSTDGLGFRVDSSLLYAAR